MSSLMKTEAKEEPRNVEKRQLMNQIMPLGQLPCAPRPARPLLLLRCPLPPFYFVCPCSAPPSSQTAEEKMSKVDKRVTDKMNEKLDNMRTGAPDGWGIVTGRGGAALTTSLAALSSKLNKLEIVMHFKQIYQTVRNFKINWPNHPILDVISGMINFLSLNFIMEPLYDRFAITLRFPGFDDYLIAMGIVSIIGLVGSFMYVWTRLWMDSYHFIQTYNTTWPEVRQGALLNNVNFF